MNGLTVSADGSVHCGNNEWFSLEAIQQAVLEAQNPNLRLIDTKPRLQTVNVNRKQTANKKQEQECLPLPSTLRTNEQSAKAGCTCKQKKQTANEMDEQHLPLPTTREAIVQRRQIANGEQEALPLPSFRTK